MDPHILQDSIQTVAVQDPPSLQQRHEVLFPALTEVGSGVIGCQKHQPPQTLRTPGRLQNVAAAHAVANEKQSIWVCVVCLTKGRAAHIDG